MHRIDSVDVFPSSEERYRVAVLSSADELDESFRLRHRIYAESLGWVPASPDGREIDQYDGWATSLGVFGTGERLLGVVRLLPSYGPMMIEHELSGAFDGGHELMRGPMANEITRLAIDPGDGRWGDKSKILLALLRGMYLWITEQSVRYSYMVVEKRVWRLLRTLGFPSRPLGPAVALPPAYAVSIAAILDWNEFREQNARVRPSFLAWMSGGYVPAAGAAGREAGIGDDSVRIPYRPRPTELIESVPGPAAG